ncbi:MAG: cache domain-containing protein [Sulfurimonas sp.]
MAVKFYYENVAQEQKIDSIMDQIKLSFDSHLKSNKMADLNIALLLAHNMSLIDALENDDEDKGYKILSDITKSIKNNTNISIRAQIITKDLDILARSWDDIYAGMPIGDYRDDLKYFKNSKKPRTSLEIGRRLGIKATVPIYKDEILLGYVEVISFFKSTTEFLSSIGVDLYVLLDTKYADSAVLMRENLSIKNYIVANISYNYNHIQSLNKIDFKKLTLSKLLHFDNKYIFYDTMYDGEMRPIGKFLFVLPQRYLGYFRHPEDDISYLINVTRSSLYNVVKQQKYGNDIYREYKASKLMQFKNLIAKEDKQIFFDEAYKKFDTLSKDELIQLMLDEKVTKHINGKIR